MKKIIFLEFFLNSKKWNNKSVEITKLSNKTAKIMKPFFNNKYQYNVNLVLSYKNEVKKLNRRYKNNNKNLLSFC